MKQLLYLIATTVFCFSLLISQNTIKIPATTIVVVKTNNQLSSKQLKTGQQLILSVAADVIVKGKKVIQSGAPVVCIVERVESAGMVGQAGNLTVSIQSTTALDGTTIALSGNIYTKGESKTGESVAVGVILCPLALLCKGGEGDIPAGAQSRALTMGEYEITIGENQSLSVPSSPSVSNDIQSKPKSESIYRSYFSYELTPGSPQLLFDGKVSLTYESAGWGKSTIKAKGIWGLSGDANGPFEKTSIQIKKGESYYMQIDEVTIYKLTIIQEVYNTLTIEFTKL
jgi:hypothetical protein